jgi:hypothetical protein
MEERGDRCAARLTILEPTISQMLGTLIRARRGRAEHRPTIRVIPSRRAMRSFRFAISKQTPQSSGFGRAQISRWQPGRNRAGHFALPPDLRIASQVIGFAALRELGQSVIACDLQEPNVNRSRRLCGPFPRLGDLESAVAMWRERIKQLLRRTQLGYLESFHELSIDRGQHLPCVARTLAIQQEAGEKQRAAQFPK